MRPYDKRTEGARGVNAGYFKAAQSGGGESGTDAEYIAFETGLDPSGQILVPYSYEAALSPRLAAQLEGNPVCLDVTHQECEALANSLTLSLQRAAEV